MCGPFTRIHHHSPGGQQCVEHHAHTSGVFALKRAVRLVGVDDPGRVRQPIACQVVIGHHHIDAALAGRLDPQEGRNTVVHRDQQVRGLFCSEVHHGRTQSVAVLEAIGDHELGVFRAQQAQAQNGHGGRCRPVSVVVAYHHDLLTVLDGLGDTPRHGIHVAHTLKMQQARELGAHILGLRHPAGSAQPGQPGRQAFGL